MYVTLYQWLVKDGKENRFIEAWTTLTQQLQAQVPALSGKLHKTQQGSYVAIINWPSQQVWETQKPNNIDLLIQKQLMDTVEEVESVIAMQVVKDLKALVN